MEKKERRHDLILQIVDHQLAEGEPEITTTAYHVFQKQGYGSLQAREMIGAALVNEIWEVMVNHADFDEERYAKTLEDMMAGIYDWEQSEEEEEIPEHLQLKDALLISSGRNLLDMMADQYGLEPSEEEEETAARIAAYLLKPEKMAQMILSLREGTVSAVEKIMKNPDADLNDRERDLLYDCGDLEDCLYYADDGRILVPEDVAALWQNVHTETFEKKRKKYVWVRSCLETAAYYYGVFDLNVLMRLVNQQPYLRLDGDEVEALMAEMPEAQNLFVKIGNRYVERDIAGGGRWKELVKAQGDYPFMVPSAVEIRDIDRWHYPYHDSAWAALRRIIAETEFDFLADDLLPLLFHRMTVADSEEDIEKIMTEENIMPEEDEFGTVWTMLSGNTRLLALRGGKRSEGKQPAPISALLFDELVNLEDRMDGGDAEEDEIPSLLS